MKYEKIDFRGAIENDLYIKRTVNDGDEAIANAILNKIGRMNLKGRDELEILSEVVMLLRCSGISIEKKTMNTNFFK